MNHLMQDLRFAFRVLANNPGFAVIAMLTLALGIGANSAIFSMVRSVLLRPMPYRDAERMVVVWEKSPRQGWERINPSGPNTMEYRGATGTLEDLAVIEAGSGTVIGFGEPMQIPGARVSNNYLSVLGVRPYLGRDFLPTEGFNDRVGIISYALWEKAFNRDPAVIGSRVIADGLPYTLIGVLPKDFWSPIPIESLVPWSDEDLRRQDPMSHRFTAIGHLKPGATVEEASAELTVVEQRIGQQYPRMAGWEVSVRPLQESLVANIRSGLWLLLLAVGLVLLIACVNLANLMLARSIGRTREIAMRLALGASRMRIAAQLLTESTLLGLAGGALGLMAAMWGVDVLQGLVPKTIPLAGGGEVIRPDIAMDQSVLWFTFVVSVLTGILFGAASAFSVSRIRVNDALKEGNSGLAPRGRKLRNLFTAFETAVALVLVNAAGLTLLAFWNLRSSDPGFRTAGLLTLELELPTDSSYRTPPERVEFFRRLLESERNVPGVTQAAVTSILPLGPDNDHVQFSVEGRPLLAEGALLPAEYRAVSAEYFAVLGIPLLRGRTFTERDTAERPGVVVISESLARRDFAGQDPIGQRLRFSAGVREIVGVVRDVRHSGLHLEPSPTFYTSFQQSPEARMTLIVRSAGDPRSLVSAAKSAVYAVDKNQPVYNIRTLEEVRSAATSSPRFALTLIGLFAVVALLLAGLGIYGVVSQSVAQSQREIGIRIALGANGVHIILMILLRVAGLAVAGIIAGLVFAGISTRLLSGIVQGLGGQSIALLPVVALVLGLVALAAAFIPALRATRINPLNCLRNE